MLPRVPKAKEGRDSMEIEIFGMSGVPPGLVPGAASLGAHAASTTKVPHQGLFKCKQQEY
eukprot:757578-Pelagomonas_calceolata.AAC.2